MRICQSIGLLAISLIATGCTSQQEWGDVIDQTYVHKYGVEVPPDYWTSAGNDGSVITTRSDGVVVKNSYVNGILDGDTSYTYPHSDKVQCMEVYHNGQKEKETIFYFDGSPMQETYYVLSSPLKYVTIWYSSGSPKSYETYEGNRLVSGEYYTLTNQRDAFVEDFEGTRMNRDDYGQLVSRDAIQNGGLLLSTTYHPNGAPKELIPYQNNQIEGDKKIFYPGGEPSSIEQWKGGSQDGRTIVFQNGEKYAEIPYTGGRKNGIEQRFRDENTVIQEIPWTNSQIHGPVKTYVGEAIKTDWYYEGEHKTQSEFDSLANRPLPRRY